MKIICIHPPVFISRHNLKNGTNLLDPQTEVEDAVWRVALPAGPADLPDKPGQSCVQLLWTQRQQVTFRAGCGEKRKRHRLLLESSDISDKNNLNSASFSWPLNRGANWDSRSLVLINYCCARSVSLRSSLSHLVWSRLFLWCHLIGQKQTAPSVSKHWYHIELWEAATFLLSVCQLDWKTKTRPDLSSPPPPASCSPATQTHTLTTQSTYDGWYNFSNCYMLRTCLLGCGRGSDSSSSSFSSARTGGREKPMSSSIPSRTGAGSEAGQETTTV